MVHPENHLLGDRTVPAEPSSSQAVDFDTFFTAEFPATVRFLMRAGASYAEAEDAVSPVMTELYARFSSVSNPRAYVRVAAIRSYIKYVERNRRGLELATRRLDPPSFSDHGNDVDERAWVLRQLRALPAAQMEVMALTFDGLTPQKIAELLGKDPQTVRANLREARRRLRQGLGTSPPAVSPEARRVNEGGSSEFPR